MDDELGEYTLIWVDDSNEPFIAKESVRLVYEKLTVQTADLWIKLIDDSGAPLVIRRHTIYAILGSTSRSRTEGHERARIRQELFHPAEPKEWE